MAEIKEPNYFSHKEILEQGLYYKGLRTFSKDSYLKLFAPAKQWQIAGEASVSYLFYPQVPFRISKIIPHAKIIIILRNPIERAFSHYLMDKRLGYTNQSFEEIIYSYNKSPSHKIFCQQYIDLGLYHDQVQRYMAAFDSSQILVLLSEQLQQNNCVGCLERFLGISMRAGSISETTRNSYREPRFRFIRALYSVRRLRIIARSALPQARIAVLKNAFLSQRTKPLLSPATRKHLQDIFTPDIQKIERLLCINLSFWYN